MHRCASSGASHCSGSKVLCSPTHHWQRHFRHNPQVYTNRYHSCTLSSRVRFQAVATKATGPQLSSDPTVISLRQYDDCELLWLQYGRQLSLNKQSIYWVLQVSWVPARVLVDCLSLALLHCSLAGSECGAHMWTVSPDVCGTVISDNVLLCVHCRRTYNKASCHVMQSC